MDSDIVETVTEWDSREISGGYAGVRDLADASFTGAVAGDMAWLFMLNGRVVGVFDGSLSAFESGEATAYEAPDPSLPLLFAMRESGGESRAKYYTEDTPLPEVDDTLSAGNFTGYVELAENVLSGDYYLVYHNGRSLPCAFVGNSRRVLTGEEAFERAADEVGIYEVYDVDIDIIDVPEPARSDAADAAAAGSAGAAGDAASGDGPDDATDSDAVAADASTADTDPASAADTADADAAAPVDDAATAATRSADASDEAPAGPTESPTPEAFDAETPTAGTSDSEDEESNAGEAVESSDRSPTNRTAPSGGDDPERAGDASGVGEAAIDDADPSGGAAEPSEADAQAASAPGGAADTDSVRTPADQDVFSEEAEWREATAIPSLDPSNSESPETDATGTGDAATAAADARPPREQSRRPTRQEASEDTADDGVESSTQPANAADAGAGTGGGAATTAESAHDTSEQVAELRERLRAVQQAREEAEADRERLSTRADELESERDRARDRVEELEARVEELQTEVERLERALEEADGAGPEGQTMPPTEALEGTNLFVRYDSKGGATLEKAHAGEVEREAFVENLRLEHHTSFDTEGLSVGGQPYESFLQRTIEYGFVRWVVEDLLYEIRETGHTGDLGELFDALPKIDRAELYGTVSVVYTEDGTENREQKTFDVVLRDRMGNPLVVANLNDSREPATGEEMTSLIQTARRVKETSESLGAAFFVTASYFEPGALETAADATGGGLLGRGKRASFVKLTRKSGFHLCLVETREGNFHVNVPEL